MIDFLKYKKIYFTISIVVISIGLFFIYRYGFNFSIDFTGGSIIEYKLNKKIEEQKLISIFQNNKIRLFSITENDNYQYLIKTESIREKRQEEIRRQIEKKYRLRTQLLRFETIGPIMGKEMTIKTFIASIIAVFGILLYLTLVFKDFRFGISAILAMIHDFLVVVGSYSIISYLFKAEVDSLFVTALLTTLSFSVHDTIVVFDKIREYERSNAEFPVHIIINRALTETMVRSFNNSLTIILMLLILILIGGITIKFFTVALLIGTITGTYSSPFIAAPLLYLLKTKRHD